MKNDGVPRAPSRSASAMSSLIDGSAFFAVIAAFHLLMLRPSSFAYFS